jgi:hypothetical protein
MADATPQRPPRAGTPGSARSGAFGFTCDSDSDGDDALLGSAARAARLGRTPTLRPGSVSSAQRARSRELAAARSFREASREKATLKQHCDALEEKIRLLEATARSDAADRSDAVAAETNALRAEADSLRAELVAAAENDEWLRRALEERAAAATVSERERAALTSRVADLEHAMEEAETCLRAASIDAEKLRRRHRRANAAATAAKLAAEATVAGLRGEVARLHAALERAGLHPGASRPIVETSDCMTSPMPIPRETEDEGEEEVTSTEANSTASAEAAPLAEFPPTTPAARDDSAMGADGVADGESVDKPQKRRVVELSSPAASIVFEYNPETKPSAKATIVDADPFASRLRLTSAPKTFGFDLAPYARQAGVDVEAAFAAFFLVVSFLRATAASAIRGAPGAAESVVGKLVAGCVATAAVTAGMMILAHDPPGFTFGVRAGALLPPQTLTWTEWLRGFVGLA